ncbi:MAG: dTDP-4-dehydrorhamnose reductase [Neisseria sp.]|nr:dTDP-4-dehydrorhamnose reductase [Neisseria sp.]
MRILLTGSKGQLGKSIREQLPEEWELIATDSKTLDITNREAVLNMVKSFQPDAIINAAGFTSVSECEKNSDKTFAVNAIGTRNLAEAARSVAAKFIHLSTDFVFSGNSRIPYQECDAPDPQCVYGRSKLAGELLALASQANTIILRTSWVFSEFGQNSVSALLEKAKTGQSIELIDNQAACPTYAGDLARAILQLLQQSNFPAGIIHYCGDQALSSYKFAQAVFQAEKERNPEFVIPELKPVLLADQAQFAMRPQYSVLNCDKARSLGLHASDWKKALTQVLKHLANQ